MICRLRVDANAHFQHYFSGIRVRVDESKHTYDRRGVLLVAVRLFALLAVDLQDLQLGLADEHVGRVDFAVVESHVQRVLVHVVDEKLHGRVPFRICRVDCVRAEFLKCAQAHLAEHAYCKTKTKKKIKNDETGCIERSLSKNYSQIKRN